jgi:asparagine synthase (glutamine-hydrolysing)
MCGILAGVSGIPIRPERIRSGLQALRHRGPDVSGAFADGEAFLGIRRLAIIDVAGGKQPIANETDSVVAVLNGEIYNFQELSVTLQQLGHRFSTRSDTEVLVHAYEQWGASFVQKLRGMFAFALWDKTEHRLLVARDRFGKKPLYYTALEGGGIALASEIKALQALVPDQPWKLRAESIYDYLSLLTVPQPHTVYRDVLMFPEASIGIFENDRWHISPYWELPRPNPQKWSYADANAAVREQISEAVRIRLISDVPLGVFLSGGIDSSIVAREASELIGESLQTFTVAVEDGALNEAPVATRTARAFGVRNELIPLQLNPLDLLETVVQHYDQPFADPSAIPSYAVARKAREYVTVVLNGDGGDEIFGGYRRYVAANFLDRFPFLKLLGRAGAHRLLSTLRRDRRGAAGFLDRLFRGTHASRGAQYLIWTTDALLEADKKDVWLGIPQRPTESWIEEILPPGGSALRRQMLGDQKIILPGLLVKMDMATMLASVEARSPLLDHKLAELVASFPDDFLVRGTRPKAILRDAFAAKLPAEVVRGKKRGFEIPLARWLQGELSEMLHDLLGAANANIGEFLDTRAVRRMLEPGTLRERNRSYILYSLLVLELWLRQRKPAPAASELALA